MLAILQRWFRDVWLIAVSRTKDHGARDTTDLLNFPEIPGTQRLAQRLTPANAIENLQVIESTQRLLHTNVQEALALEVGLLKLNL